MIISGLDLFKPPPGPGAYDAIANQLEEEQNFIK